MSDVTGQLIAGRDMVIERGHRKHESESADGRVCAARALSCLSITDPAYVALADAAHALYPERIVHHHRRVTSFNDHPDTTPGEVIDVFDYAIAREKEKLANG